MSGLVLVLRAAMISEGIGYDSFPAFIVRNAMRLTQCKQEYGFVLHCGVVCANVGIISSKFILVSAVDP